MKDYEKVISIKTEDEEELLPIRIQEAAEDGYVVDKLVRLNGWVVLYFVES